MTNSQADGGAIAVPTLLTLGVLRRRRLVVVVAILALAALAVVGWSEWRHSSSIAPAANAEAVSGVVVSAGGPLYMTGQSDIRPIRSASLVVTGTTAVGVRLVRHLRADEHGRFALNLPPGAYTVAAVVVGPPFLPLARQPHANVTVTRGHSVRVRITSDVL